MVKLTILNDTYWSLVQTKNDSLYRKHKEKFDVSKYLSPEEILTNKLNEKNEVDRISLSRTKNHIKEICLCNDFEYFATITVSSKNEKYNRFDLEDCIDNMKKLMKKIQRKYNDFKYIYIIEEHKKGGYHFHGFIKGLPVDCFYINENGYLSCSCFDILGFNSFSKIRSYNKACNYITKYITKNCLRTENNQVYFCSRGLKRGTEYLLTDNDLSNIFGDNLFENEFCKKKDFDITRMDKSTLLKLNDYFQSSDNILKQQNNSYITFLLQILTKQKININM